jgi:hypothetical protein
VNPDGCYTWQPRCYANSFPDPCQVNSPGAASCLSTPVWFWVMAGALGLALIVGGNKR